MNLNHTIVPAHDKHAAARFFTDLLGLRSEPPFGPFAVVRVNDELTLDIADRDAFEPHHYAFHVSDEEFDRIFARIREAGLTYGADPRLEHVGELNHRRGGRGVYFRDPNGHILELLTRP